jgi:acetylornithine deacetylase
MADGSHMDTLDFLAKLVAFPSVSALSNRPLIAYVADYLTERGFACEMVEDATGTKASLFATIGPETATGIVLSAHVDVVPAKADEWDTDPYTLVQVDDRVFGRGTTDMKGFVACILALAGRIDQKKLQKPLHIALSYDEEIGCIGVRPMLDILAQRGLAAELCIVGEPTSMQIMCGHKGKISARATCRGVAGHSASAPRYLNAVHLACDFVAALRAEQAQLANGGHSDREYDIPYTTLHTGKISGGTALNIVPELATVDFEIRNVPSDNPNEILTRLEYQAQQIARRAGEMPDGARIDIEVLNAYPGLDIAPATSAVMLARQFVDTQETAKVSFGTEAGLFAEKLGMPTVVLGPGSMAQGHTSNEFVEISQLRECDRMLVKLQAHLERAAN